VGFGLEMKFWIGFFNCCGSELMVKWIWVCFSKEEDQRLELGLEHENVVDVGWVLIKLEI